MTEKGETGRGGGPSITANHGDSPYVPKKNNNKPHPWEAEPWCIYFYYVGPPVAAGGRRIVRHYTYESASRPITEAQIPDLLRRLAINAARPEDQQFPWPDGQDWKDIQWYRRSYIAVVIDDPAIHFLGTDNGLVFTNEKNGNENYSFYDGKEILINVAPSTSPARNVPALYCTNHMKKNQAGADLGSETKYYNFVLNTNIDLGFRQYPDSGGTNNGPPIPP